MNSFHGSSKADTYGGVPSAHCKTSFFLVTSTKNVSRTHSVPSILGFSRTQTQQRRVKVAVLLCQHCGFRARDPQTPYLMLPSGNIQSKSKL